MADLSPSLPPSLPLKCSQFFSARETIYSTPRLINPLSKDLHSTTRKEDGEKKGIQAVDLEAESNKEVSYSPAFFFSFASLLLLSSTRPLSA